MAQAAQGQARPHSPAPLQQEHTQIKLTSPAQSQHAQMPGNQQSSLKPAFQARNLTQLQGESIEEYDKIVGLAKDASTRDLCIRRIDRHFPNLDEHERSDMVDEAVLAANGGPKKSKFASRTKFVAVVAYIGGLFHVLVRCVWGDFCTSRATEAPEYAILLVGFALSMLLWYFGFWVVAKTHSKYGGRVQGTLRKEEDLSCEEKVAWRLMSFWGYIGTTLPNYCALFCWYHSTVTGAEIHLAMLNMRKVITVTLIAYFYESTVVPYFHGFGSVIIICVWYVMETFLTSKENCMSNGKVYSTLTRGDTKYRNTARYNSERVLYGMEYDDASTQEDSVGLTADSHNNHNNNNSAMKPNV